MRESDPGETLQQLDRRHDELIHELNQLNLRLEQTLSSISESKRSTESAEEERATEANTLTDGEETPVH